MNPINDKDFLFQLYQQKNHEVYANITVLTFEEQPVESIQGRVTSGSVNIDGASAVRRTCNLSLIVDDLNLTDYYWGVSNKFKLEIGLKNHINSTYPDIIWFKQGIFVITSFNISLNANGHSISINGKDKMCLLNGDIAGNLPSSIDFGQIDSYDKSYTKVTIEDMKDYKALKYYIEVSPGKYELSTEPYDKNKTYYEQDMLLSRDSLKIEDIIRESVHTYGKEDYHNIIINDLSDYGLELMEYRGDQYLYLLYDEDAGIYTNITYDDSIQIGDYKLSTLPANRFNTAVNKLNGDRYIFQWTGSNDKIFNYSVTRLSSGDVAGYRTTDLIYAGELISSIGESLTSVLDKIKNMLGPFEYFYDVDGRFIFQATKTYQNTSWNTLQEVDGDIFARDLVEDSPYEFSFEDANLISAFQNTPAINNIKNDYSVWGMKKTLDGAEVPIHARYAISKKPEYYKSFDGVTYIAEGVNIEEIKQTITNQLKNELIDRIEAFQPKYINQTPNFLTRPQRKENGDWTPGWWDIRDWHDYYVTIKKEEPSYTMKWYSKNDLSGCQKAKDVSSNLTYNDDYYVWLLIVSENNGEYYINPQHGMGDPTLPASLCTVYESVMIDGEIQNPKKVYPEQTKYFIQPYAGCSDTHTYLEFLRNDIMRDGNLVYFYNPNFPGADTYDDVIKDQIEEEFEEMITTGKLLQVDWRELIYQMAKDYYANNQKSNYQTTLIKNNVKSNGVDNYYPSGKTGYEIFYSDMQAFWRQLYDINPSIAYDYEGGKYIEEKVYAPDGVTYSLETKWVPYKQLNTFTCDYYLEGEPDENGNYSKTKKYWHKNVDQNPEQLNFWIDFFDNTDSLSQYSVQLIGDRPKIVNNNKVTSIYFRNVPQVILCNPEKYNGLDIKTGYTYVYVDNGLNDLFTISARGKSAEEEINNLFYYHSCCAENITITAIPVYHLVPNTLIYVYNEDSGINGKFKIDKISLPLTYNGTMSITASKVIDRIY